MSVGVLALVLCTFKVFFMHTDSLWCVFHASNVDVRSYDRYIRYIWSKVLKYCVFLHILNFFSVCFIEFNNRQLFWDLTSSKSLLPVGVIHTFFKRWPEEAPERIETLINVGVSVQTRPVSLWSVTFDVYSWFHAKAVQMFLKFLEQQMDQNYQSAANILEENIRWTR